jgi:hypothetical protein
MAASLSFAPWKMSAGEHANVLFRRIGVILIGRTAFRQVIEHQQDLPLRLAGLVILRANKSEVGATPVFFWHLCTRAGRHQGRADRRENNTLLGSFLAERGSTLRPEYLPRDPPPLSIRAQRKAGLSTNYSALIYN